jgi:trk system potassium uptake protein TrkA
MPKEKHKVFAVIGLGTFGRRVAEVLADRGGEVIAIDNNPDLIDRVKDSVTQAVLLDATDETSLANAPFDDVDVAVVAIGDNVAASILATALLKRVGIPYILARSISDLHEQVLRQIGADEIVNIEIDEGQRIAMRLMSPEILDRIPVSESISVAELYVPRSFVGKSIGKLELRKRFNVTVISITRTNLSVDEMGNPVRNEQIIFPKSEDTLEESDVMLVVGKNDDIDAMKEF